jgi:hypothetical protein
MVELELQAQQRMLHSLYLHAAMPAAGCTPVYG